MNNNLPDIVVADTETSGLDPESGAALLELATVKLMRTGGVWGMACDSHYVEHIGKIPSAAKAVHHITEEQVAPGAPGCISRGAVYEQLLALPDETVVAFHNAPFDLKFLPELDGRPVICTYRAALHIYPEAPSHSLQALRYELDLKPPEALLGGMAPHRAQYDAVCTATLLIHMLEKYSLSEILEYSVKPAVLHRCRFGRYRGMRWSEVPRDYMRWVLRDGKFDEDVLHTVRHYLEH